MEDMKPASAYKEKLLREIEEIPDDLAPSFYRIVHVLKTEWVPETKKNSRRGSLKGIWRGSQIDDALFDEARDSLFPYELR
jgi:hypothetical protein